MKKFFVSCGWIMAVTACITTAEGQHTPEYSVYLGGGVSTLQYRPVMGEKGFWGSGGLFGIGFNYLFTGRIGLGAGIEVSLYTSTATVNNRTFSYPAYDPEGTSFVLNGEIGGFKEKQQALLLNIPVMLQYQHGKGLNKFYVAAGGKIGVFPVFSRYSGRGATLHTSGNYDPPRELSPDDMQKSGFGDFDVSVPSGDFPVQPYVTASVETGMRWRFNKHVRLYTGIYADYGLTDIRKEKKNAPLVVYSNAGYSVNSVVATAGKVAPLAAGVIVRLAFGPNQTRGRSVPSPNIFMKENTGNGRTR
ncbi:MAG: PorT family protein [Bacteroidales bacterium]|jgi:hypothetical protein|nr:PorT family protein [Bacteroidales bacterium]